MELWNFETQVIIIISVKQSPQLARHFDSWFTNQRHPECSRFVMAQGLLLPFDWDCYQLLPRGCVLIGLSGSDVLLKLVACVHLDSKLMFIKMVIKLAF